MSTALVAALLLLTSQVEKPADAASSALESFKQQAAGYEMTLASDRKSPLTLVKTPVLHWGNPARTGEDGAVFLWTSRGRPQVIGSIFTYKLGEKVRTKHEFHSLALEPLSASYKGKTAWTPDKPGMKFEPLPVAPTPADTPRGRATQMRQLARQFSGRLTDLEEKSAELRLMPNPIYRYESDDKTGPVDGAIFAYALGTDPEILLLLEARKADGGLRRWEYACARFHYVHLWLSFNGKEVFHVEADADQPLLNFGDQKAFTKTYVSFHVEP